MNKEEYAKYLQSAHWQKRREESLKNKECWCCGKKVNLAVHHLSYASLGKERDSELVVLCSRCHKYVHFAKKKRKVGIYESHLRLINLKNKPIQKEKKKKEPKNWEKSINRARAQLDITCTKRYSKAKQY